MDDHDHEDIDTDLSYDELDDEDDENGEDDDDGEDDYRAPLDLHQEDDDRGDLPEGCHLSLTLEG